MSTEKEVVLVNHSKNEFIDISSEEYRVYVYDMMRIERINNPLYLSVSDSGHRILDAEGISHYMPKGWVHLKWKAKEGQPHFVK